MRDLPSGSKAQQELHERPSVAATPEARLHFPSYLLISITPPGSNLLVHKQYLQQHPPKPSLEIYLAVEVENEYFTVDLADQLPTSCCCILCLVRDNTQTQP